jgi:hypothetical protein
MTISPNYAEAPNAWRNACDPRLLYWIVLTTSIACSIYASIDARGLYHDGVYILFKVAEHNWFFLHAPARNSVEILRQAPIVLLSVFTSMPLFQRGQVFTFIMLALPTILCALCWLIAQRDRKAWVLFPLAYLLIGFEATSIHAIGEAAVATSYFWILLFLFLFRTRSVGSQVFFLLLSIPALQLQEGAFPLTAVLLFACFLRVRSVVDLRERLFVGVGILWFVTVLAYQVSWIIHPHRPPELMSVLQGLMQLQFLYVDGHLNLPFVTGTVASSALVAAFVINATQSSDDAVFGTRIIAVGFALFALIAVAVAVLIEKSFAPFAHLQARYHPMFVGTALGATMVLVREFRVPHRLWMQPATIIILISLCGAQMAANVVATGRWHAYVVDLQSRLGNARGLIPWEATLHTGDKHADINWHLMAISWVIPVTSIVFAPSGQINSMIDLPVGTTYRPVDPEKPLELPPLYGIDYSPYRQAVLGQSLPPTTTK